MGVSQPQSCNIPLDGSRRYGGLHVGIALSTGALFTYVRITRKALTVAGRPQRFYLAAAALLEDEDMDGHWSIFQRRLYFCGQAVEAISYIGDTGTDCNREFVRQNALPSNISPLKIAERKLLRVSCLQSQNIPAGLLGILHPQCLNMACVN